jgi:hypothetical protein
METPVDTGFINVSLYKKILDQRGAYGTCETAYILHDAYKLSYGMIARLMGVSVGTVKQCVHRMRSRQQAKTQKTQSTPVPLDIPTFEAFKEVCRGSALSLECQMLETEAFVFDVAKRALPATAFWDVFVYAKSVHRIAFPDIYNLLVELAGMDSKRLRKLLRATKVKDRWYVGDGLVAYTYNLIDKACFHRGYYNTRLSYNTLAVIELLTRKNPTREPIVYLTMVISDRLAHIISTRRTEILQTMKEVYATITRMYDLD